MRISTAAKSRKKNENCKTHVKLRKVPKLSPQISYLNVNYAKAKDLTERVKQIIRKSALKSFADDRSNTIIVRDSKMDLEEDDKNSVTKLDVRTPQVLIESNLIETTPTFARSLGLRFRFSTPVGTTISNAAGARGDSPSLRLHRYSRTLPSGWAVALVLSRTLWGITRSRQHFGGGREGRQYTNHVTTVRCYVE